MGIVFTICSNNYLAQAKTLGDSLMQFNSGYRFVIALVDKLNEAIDYTFFSPYEIIPIDKLEIDGFDEMFARYNITELNTSVKPFIFNYLFLKNQQVENVIYLDPDIIIYDSLREIQSSLAEYDIVLTPHFFTPIYDSFELNEPNILNAGLYNLGFLAVKRSVETDKFLKWWMIKLKDQCYIDFMNGLFVDQLWINFVPIYFKNVLILRHLGHNVAYWNLHERTITGDANNYSVNATTPLVFYHFSGFNFNKPESISKYQTRYNFNQRADIIPLFQDYTKRLIENKHEKYSLLPCFYIELKEKYDRIRLAAEKTDSKTGVLRLGKRAIKKILSRLTT